MSWITKFFFVVLSVLSFNVYALEVGPLVHEITTGTKDNRTKVTLTNNSVSQQLIDTTVTQLVFKGGSYDFDIMPNSNSDLLVFPPAFKLGPGETQTVIVIWSGLESLPESRSYSLKFTAINDSNLTGKDAIGIELNFNVIVHVRSEKLVAQIDQVPVPVSKTEDGMVFTILNRGSKYSKLSNYDIILKSSQKKLDYKIPSQKIISMGLDKFLPANQAVDIIIPYSRLPDYDVDLVVLVEKVRK